eukprot:Sspe_Gene.7311::Locus_2480_Transcript_1_1_Confidence_1.000_Length_1572::g.7311::m.7311
MDCGMEAQPYQPPQANPDWRPMRGGRGFGGPRRRRDYFNSAPPSEHCAIIPIEHQANPEFESIRASVCAVVALLKSTVQEIDAVRTSAAVASALAILTASQSMTRRFTPKTLLELRHAAPPQCEQTLQRWSTMKVLSTSIPVATVKLVAKNELSRLERDGGRAREDVARNLFELLQGIVSIDALEVLALRLVGCILDHPDLAGTVADLVDELHEDPSSHVEEVMFTTGPRPATSSSTVVSS